MKAGVLIVSGIYRIRHCASGKVYIGSAAHIARRWAQHRCGLAYGKHHNARLQNAWNKHGRSAFVFEVMERVPVEQLMGREQAAIDAARSYDARFGYNLHPTAERGGMTAAAARKVWATRRARGTDTWTDEQRAAQRGVFIGRSLTAEHRANIGAAGKGRKRPDVTERLTRLWASREASAMVRARIGAAHRGRVKTAEHRSKIAATVKRLHAEGRYC